MGDLAERRSGVRRAKAARRGWGLCGVLFYKLFRCHTFFSRGTSRVRAPRLLLPCRVEAAGFSRIPAPRGVAQGRAGEY
eukprot:7027006-Lingulodinium_polyedra.AAC.1